MTGLREGRDGGEAAWPVVVVGAGAAGFLASIFAARRLGTSSQVLLLETRKQPGAKIRVSGGGRCNVLPSVAELSDFHTEGSEKSLRNVLFSWPLDEVTAFFRDELDIPLKVEPNGKVFPASDKSQDVVKALVEAAGDAGVELRCDARIVDFRVLDRDAGDSGARFELHDVHGRVVRAARVVLCTGGLSLPRTGSDGWGLRLSESLGHEMERTYPVLVPLTVDGSPWTDLTGIAIRARLRAMSGGRQIGVDREDNLLFTHRGFSGPVVLDISRWFARDEHSGQVELRVSWLGSRAPNWREKLERGGKKQIIQVLSEDLPKRVAATIVAVAGLKRDLRVCDVCKEGREGLLEQLEDCPLPIEGDEGYATAEATGGGVRLSEVKLKSLESRKVPGLHFAGEVIDVDGRIGGFNFLWSWVSGRKAGEAAAKAHLKGG